MGALAPMTMVVTMHTMNNTDDGGSNMMSLDTTLTRVDLDIRPMVKSSSQHAYSLIVLQPWRICHR
jgi:hypothetical protein